MFSNYFLNSSLKLWPQWPLMFGGAGGLHYKNTRACIKESSVDAGRSTEARIQTLTARRPAERSPPSPGSYTLQWFMNICVFDTNQDPWTKFFFYSSSNPQPFSFYSSRLCWRSLYKNKQKIQPSLRDLHQPITLQFHQPTLQTKKHQKIGETRIYWYILNIDLTNKI